MIILLYLIVIVGWALLILIIKCRKAREKRIAMAQEAQSQAIHVIQIGNNLYDVIPITNASHLHHTHNCRRFHSQDSTGSLHNTHTNPSFIMDEAVYPGNNLILDRPPSYDEVIRLPSQYPKINSRQTTPNSNLPPTIIEMNQNPSITTITSSSPAVISGNHHDVPISVVTPITTTTSTSTSSLHTSNSTINTVSTIA